MYLFRRKLRHENAYLGNTKFFDQEKFDGSDQHF